MSRTLDISEELLATIVAESGRHFVNENKLAGGVFSWQNSASAFSVSKSDVDQVCKYILNQPEHHRKVTFAEEFETIIQHYQETLQRNKVIR